MQSSVSDLEYATKKRLTRRDRFLGEIETVTPWSAMVAELEPFYPQGEGRGRPLIGLERMLRMYMAHQLACRLALGQEENFRRRPPGSSAGAVRAGQSADPGEGRAPFPCREEPVSSSQVAGGLR